MRGGAIADLLTAVLASEHSLALVHYNADFDLAAEVLEVDHRRVASRGTL